MADDIAEAVASPAKRYAAPVIEERDYTQEALAQYGLKEAHIASITPSKDKKKSDLRSATPKSGKSSKSLLQRIFKKKGEESNGAMSSPPVIRKPTLVGTPVTYTPPPQPTSAPSPATNPTASTSASGSLATQAFKIPNHIQLQRVPSFRGSVRGRRTGNTIRRRRFVGDLLIKLQEEKRAKEKKEQAQEEEHKEIQQQTDASDSSSLSSSISSMSSLIESTKEINIQDLPPLPESPEKEKEAEPAHREKREAEMEKDNKDKDREKEKDKFNKKKRAREGEGKRHKDADKTKVAALQKENTLIRTPSKEKLLTERRALSAVNNSPSSAVVV